MINFFIEIIRLQAEQEATNRHLQELQAAGDSSEAMIREMITEREILEKSLASTKENFSRVEADYRKSNHQLKDLSAQMGQARQSLNVSQVFTFIVHFKFIILRL